MAGTGKSALVQSARTLLALLWIALLAGCSGGSSNGAGGVDGGSLAIVPGTVGLAVTSAMEQSSIGTTQAGTNQMFATVHFEVANGLSNAVPLSPTRFRVQTKAGLQKAASSSSSQLSGACPKGAFLAGTKTIDCALTFELDRTETPIALVYVYGTASSEAGAAAQVQAPIDNFVACKRCGGPCVDLMSDINHCGACDVTVPYGGSCVKGVPTCPKGETACGDTCVDLSTSITNCGKCGNMAPTGGSCVDGGPKCPALTTLCGDTCANLSSSKLDCGKCGNKVPAGCSCNLGAPSCP